MRYSWLILLPLLTQSKLAFAQAAMDGSSSAGTPTNLPAPPPTQKNDKPAMGSKQGQLKAKDAAAGAQPGPPPAEGHPPPGPNAPPVNKADHERLAWRERRRNARVAHRVKALDQRVSRVEATLASIDRKLAEMDKKVDRVAGELAELKPKPTTGTGPLLEVTATPLLTYTNFSAHDCNCQLLAQGNGKVAGWVPTFNLGIGYRNGGFRAGIYGSLGPDLSQHSFVLTNAAFGGAIAFDVAKPLGLQIRLFRDLYRVAGPPDQSGVASSWSFSGYGFGLDTLVHTPLKAGHHGVDGVVGADYSGLSLASDEGGDSLADARVIHFHLGIRLYFGTDLMGDDD